MSDDVFTVERLIGARPDVIFDVLADPPNTR